MKFSTEFQPRRVLGLSIIFLIFFCPFFAWGDPDFDFDSDSDEDSFGYHLWAEATTTTTTSRTTGTGTGKAVPDSHVILSPSEENNFRRKIECRGVDVSNLTVITCDGTIIECRNRLSCLLSGTSCTSHDEVSVGRTCLVRQSSHYSRVHYSRIATASGARIGTEKCLDVPVLWPMRTGVVKCISSLSAQRTPSKMTTTIDYFYIGVDSKVHLLSSHKPANTTMLKLGMTYSGQEVKSIFAREDEKTEPEVLYTNEQLVLTCNAANFLIDSKSLKIEARTQNGTEHQIDPAMYSKTFASSSTEFFYTKIQRFRVPKGIHSLSCVGRRLDNSEIIRTTTNFIVIDPPSRLLVKSPNGSEFQVNSQIGCNLYPSHTKTELATLRRKLFSLLDISRHSEFWITSPIAFLRFQKITKGNFSCSPLKSDGNSNSNSTDRFDYYFDLDGKKPRIEKPTDGISTIDLSGDNHRSLKCKYTGNPMPFVIWLQNGKEIFYTVGTETSSDEPGFETAVLHLPLENPDNSTEISGGVYSCVVSNHLGVDRLGFLVENEKASAGVSGTSRSSSSQSKSKSEERGNGLFYGLVISCLCVIILIGFVFNFIQSKRRTKRAVVSKRRGDERGAYSPRVGEFSYVDSGNASNPIENPNHSHPEISNNGISHGISSPSKFQSGEAKYQVFT